MYRRQSLGDDGRRVEVFRVFSEDDLRDVLGEIGFFQKAPPNAAEVLERFKSEAFASGKMGLLFVYENFVVGAEGRQKVLVALPEKGTVTWGFTEVDSPRASIFGIGMVPVDRALELKFVPCYERIAEVVRNAKLPTADRPRNRRKINVTAFEGVTLVT